MAYRRALRRTQKQVDAERKSKVDIATAERAELQALAKERGIKANQSTETLRELLS